MLKIARDLRHHELRLALIRAIHLGQEFFRALFFENHHLFACFPLYLFTYFPVYRRLIPHQKLLYTPSRFCHKKYPQASSLRVE